MPKGQVPVICRRQLVQQMHQASSMGSLTHTAHEQNTSRDAEIGHGRFPTCTPPQSVWAAWSFLPFSSCACRSIKHIKMGMRNSCR
eukprot:224080-Pelagomonas_calceolata.AAC.1